MTATDPLEDRNEIMTLEEVATYLRLKPQTIYRWAQEKRIPAAKLGKEWRFRRSILDRWLDEQMVGEGSCFAHLRDGNNGSS
jgi:excisionase family DNA binding protein